MDSLSAADFRIFDDQFAVKRLRNFSRMNDLPLQVGILLDVSDSVQKTVLREKLATQFFVHQVLRPQSDRAFLMAFGQEVKLWQASTGDPDALERPWSGSINSATLPTSTTACFTRA